VTDLGWASKVSLDPLNLLVGGVEFAARTQCCLCVTRENQRGAEDRGNNESRDDGNQGPSNLSPVQAIRHRRTQHLCRKDAFPMVRGSVHRGPFSHKPGTLPESVTDKGATFGALN
jgi:hypothetical protein